MARFNFGPAFMEQVQRIQRPELNDRARKFLGIKSGNVLGDVANVVQPVLILGNLDEPISLQDSRIPAIAAAEVVGAGIEAGVAVCCLNPATQDRHLNQRLYLKRLTVTYSATATGAPLPLAFANANWSFHPTSPAIRGKRKSPFTGGDPNIPFETRSGVRADSNASGFPMLFPSSFRLRKDLVNVFDMSDWQVQSFNVTGVPGGNGGALWLIDLALPAAETMWCIWEWDEETLGP